MWSSLQVNLSCASSFERSLSDFFYSYVYSVPKTNSVAGDDIFPSPPAEYASTRRTYVFPGFKFRIVASSFRD